MNKKPSNQHFVPKVYLKNFAYNEDGDIYLLRIKFNYLTKVKLTNISAICYQKDIYTIQTEDLLERRKLSDNFVLEKEGFKYEQTDFKEKLDKIVQGDVLTMREARVFLNYLINIKERNPISRDIIVNKKWLKKELEDRLTKAESLLEFSTIEEEDGYNKAKNVLAYLRIEGNKFIEDDKSVLDIHREHLLSSHLGLEDKNKTITIDKLLKYKFII